MIITEPKQAIASYVAAKCGVSAECGPFAAVAEVRNGRIIAGVIFQAYAWPNIFVSLAADLLTPGFVCAFMHYPFKQLKCACMSSFVARGNKASRKLTEHFGGELRGVLKNASTTGDLLIYQLMAEKASRWLAPRYMRKLQKELPNGQKLEPAAA